MRALNSYIKENSSHIRNIFYDSDVYEELNKIINTGHSVNRKAGRDDINYNLSNNKGGITNKVIRKIFDKIDHIILEGCELNKFKYLSDSDKPSEIGIVDFDGKESIMIICFIDNYDESDNKYDIKIKTVGRRDHEQKVRDVTLEIIIKGKYKNIKWH